MGYSFVLCVFDDEVKGRSVVVVAGNRNIQMKI